MKIRIPVATIVIASLTLIGCNTSVSTAKHSSNGPAKTPQIVASADVIACPGQGWTHYGAAPEINKEHIFCGEISGHLAKGFHARPDGNNPATVAQFDITQPANAQDIYGGIAHLDIHGEQAQKFSTMFPDRCDQEEVLNSVLYAYHHQIACPAGAPNWASCGDSNPVVADGTPRCDGVGGAYTIAFATLANGNINTAFPLR